MCSLNRKCHSFFKLLMEQFYHVRKRIFRLSFICFFSPSNTDGKLSELTLWPFLVLFASSSSRRNFKSSSDNVANLDFDSTMTTLIKLLVSMLGDVTSAA